MRNVRRILVTEPEGFDPEAMASLRALGEVTTGPLGRAALLAAAEATEVIMIRLGHRIDAELIGRAPGLRFVVTPTTGLDHIDLERAAQAGITVLSLRGEERFLRTVHATAEHCWALLLALLRNLPAAVRSVHEGGWDRDRFKGRELAGRSLGIVGLGRIGTRVARYAQAFDMGVAAYDPYLQEWPQDVGRCGSLVELAGRSDVLSIHVHLGEATRNLVNAEVLAAMPPKSYVVNTSRGAVLDEDALLAALQRGHLAGAAVDVLSGEIVPTGSAERMLDYARKHDNLIITPHVGGATYDSMAKTERFMVAKLERALQEQGPQLRPG